MEYLIRHSWIVFIWGLDPKNRSITELIFKGGILTRPMKSLPRYLMKCPKLTKKPKININGVNW